MRFAYADPPYFGMGKKMYGALHPDAEIWDDKRSHIDLVGRLADEYPDGWVLSCNPRDLAWLYAECPTDARVGAWTKTFHQIRPTTTQFSWEPVIFRGGRIDGKRKPMVRDWLSCPIAMKKGLQGAKPDKFNQWVLDLMAFDTSEDEMDEIFPGTEGLTALIERLREAA